MLIASVVLAAMLRQTPAVPSADRMDINMIVVRLNTRADVLSHCNNPGSIDGCTFFVGEQVQARCTAADARWTIAATARVTAVVYVSSAAVVTHEMHHIRDVRTSADAYLQEVGSTHFGTKPECDAAAGFVSSGFRDRLAAMAATSRGKRD